MKFEAEVGDPCAAFVIRDLESDAPRPPITRSIGTFATLEQAIERARRFAGDRYVFEYVTPRTRLLAWYDLTANRSYTP